MFLGQEFNILGNWFIIHFTENNGMALGMEFEFSNGKLFLSIFRLIAIIFIGWLIYYLVKKKANSGLIVCFSLIFAGAAGNIIDSVFYGVIFNDSFYQVASFMPAEGGYSKFFEGKVVDMFYFPVIQTHYPSWFPFWGGEEFIFFRPVFNIADFSISMGVLFMILFQKRYFKEGNFNLPVQENNNTATSSVS